MTLVRYEPWSLLNQFNKELDTLFRQPSSDNAVATSDWHPAVDIKESDNAFTLVADIPGVDPNDIEIHMEDGVLTIKGQREFNQEEEQEGYKRVERAYGSFYRRFSMPDTADAERIKATSKHGVLEVVIPKQEKTEPRKITVQH